MSLCTLLKISNHFKKFGLYRLFILSLTVGLSLLLPFSPIFGLSAPVSAQPVILKPEDLASQAAILMDAHTGQILFEKNMHEKLPPASVTKIMTGLLAVEKGDFSDTLTLSHEAVFSVPRDATHIALDADETLTLEQAMYAMMLASANDAANGIGEYISGSLHDFTALMNQRAVELGAQDTHFVNTNGLSNPQHYSSAHDLALFTKEALKYPQFVKVWGCPRYQIPPTNKQPLERILNHQNKMLLSGKYHYEGVTGGKLGWTTEAQNTMVVVAEREGRQLICVLLKSQAAQDKYLDARLLLDYGFSQFRQVTIDDLKLAGSYSFLLHQSLSLDLVSRTYSDILTNPDGSSNATVTFSLAGDSGKLMYPEIGSLVLSAPGVPAQSSHRQEKLISLGVFLLKLVLGLFLFLFVLACFFRTRRRIRRRKRQLARQKAQGNLHRTQDGRNPHNF